MKTEKIAIHTEYIRLDQLLKLAGAVLSGGEAKERIAQGEVAVNGIPCVQRGKKLRPGDTAALDQTVYQITEEHPL